MRIILLQHPVVKGVYLMFDPTGQTWFWRCVSIISSYKITTHFLINYTLDESLLFDAQICDGWKCQVSWIFLLSCLEMNNNKIDFERYHHFNFMILMNISDWNFPRSLNFEWVDATERCRETIMIYLYVCVFFAFFSSIIFRNQIIFLIISIKWFSQNPKTKNEKRISIGWFSTYHDSVDVDGFCLWLIAFTFPFDRRKLN